MVRNSKKGFTLIELMVVIVIIGVLASLAIPRFTEASAKAKMGEAPRIIASYESGYLATLAELGTVTEVSQLIVAIPTTSKWFSYNVANSAGTLNAVAANNIGVFLKDWALQATYETVSDCFTHAVSGASATNAATKLVPNFVLGPIGCQ
jgi:prepilin-type N-terminal cleavage/methylation domain-containing protein